MNETIHLFTDMDKRIHKTLDQKAYKLEVSIGSLIILGVLQQLQAYLDQLLSYDKFLVIH